jgi:hypothetical protein
VSAWRRIGAAAKRIEWRVGNGDQLAWHHNRVTSKYQQRQSGIA